MAGQTGIGDFFGQTDIKGGVRVDMTAYAPLEIEMCRPGVATTAGGDYFQVGRRMAPVAVETEVLVGLPGFLEETDNLSVALPAVFRSNGGIQRPAVEIEPLGPNRGQLEKNAEASYYQKIFIKFQNHQY